MKNIETTAALYHTSQFSQNIVILNAFDVSSLLQTFNWDVPNVSPSDSRAKSNYFLRFSVLSFEMLEEIYFRCA
jgi:hypothetical protein